MVGFETASKAQDLLDCPNACLHEVAPFVWNNHSIVVVRFLYVAGHYSELDWIDQMGLGLVGLVLVVHDAVAGVCPDYCWVVSAESKDEFLCLLMQGYSLVVGLRHVPVGLTTALVV